MARKAVVDASGNVLNVIEIEPGADWPTPEGCTLVDASNGGEPGGTYQAGQFTPASEG